MRRSEVACGVSCGLFLAAGIVAGYFVGVTQAQRDRDLFAAQDRLLHIRNCGESGQVSALIRHKKGDEEICFAPPFHYFNRGNPHGK